MAKDFVFAPAARTFGTQVERKASALAAPSVAPAAKNVAFTLKSWNLAVQAYPERPEELPTETTTSK